MNAGNRVEDYDRRLQQLPKANKELEEEIRSYAMQVQGQENEMNTQNVKIKLCEQELYKLDKAIETRENQIQELAESEEKSAQKQKKYFMQIENYNKKIETLKGEASKMQKSIVVLKKQGKLLESTLSSANSDKNKVLQQLTKGQLKLNALTQTLNDLKAKAMDKAGQKGDDLADNTKRDEKQLNDLFLAIKKQMQLIDVLKKQKVHLIAATVFKYCQDDFSKLLQMNRQS